MPGHHTKLDLSCQKLHRHSTERGNLLRSGGLAIVVGNEDILWHVMVEREDPDEFKASDGPYMLFSVVPCGTRLQVDTLLGHSSEKPKCKK